MTLDNDVLLKGQLIVEKKNFTPKQRALLGLIAEATVLQGELKCSKEDLAHRLNCCTKTVDRAVKALREEGAIEVEEHFLANGSQSFNSYRIHAAH